jgi:hypothetical protein
MMNIKLEYENKPVSDYVSLIGCYPESEFRSPYRSTVPFLYFWSNTQDRLIGFTKLLGLKPPLNVTACFEFRVDVQKGKGKPSQTDLMITFDDNAIAIEAKYTEPPYEPVRAWMRDFTNRRQVLEGWLDLICSATGQSKITVEDVAGLPYQLILRCASVCFLDVTHKTVVYQCFGLNEEKIFYYQSQLLLLDQLLSRPKNLHFFLVNIPLLKSPAYIGLQNRWDSGERKIHADVIKGMKSNNFMDFGEPKVVIIE